MENNENNMSQVSKKERAGKTNKKLKWREIEQIKDKYQLEKDLKSFEYSLEHLLDEF